MGNQTEWLTHSFHEFQNIFPQYNGINLWSIFKHNGRFHTQRSQFNNNLVSD